MTKKHDAQSDMEKLADQLHAAVGGVDPDARLSLNEGAAASLGGTLGAVLALVAAIRSGDTEQIKAALLALLTIILAPSTSAQAALFGGGHKIDWSKILGVIERLLPLILGIAGA